MTHARTEVDWSKPGAGDGRCLTCQHRGVRMKHWLSFPVSLLAGHLERHHRATESTDAGWVGSVLDQVQSVRADYAGQVGEKTGAPLTVWQAWIMAEKAVMRDRAARVEADPWPLGATTGEKLRAIAARIRQRQGAKHALAVVLEDAARRFDRGEPTAPAPIRGLFADDGREP